MEDQVVQPESDEAIDVVNPEEYMPGLASYIKGKFDDSEKGRFSHEQRWLQAYKNFRGIYDSTTQYRDSERSKVFIKITKTKVLAAYGQIIDILFANKKFPIVVEPTPVPEGVAEFAHLKTPVDAAVEQPAADPYGYEGDGKELPPGATAAEEPKDYLGAYSKDFADAPVVRGPSKVGEPQISPAQKSALMCEKQIHDQLLDTNATTIIRKAIFEASMLGTGVVKGPLNMYKRIHKWGRNEQGEREYQPDEKVAPRLEHVPLWDFHPDPSATSIEDCEYVIQRHRMNRQQLRSLILMPHFNAETITNVLNIGPNYEDKYYEDTIRDDETQANYQENRYEVLEYWGVIDSKFAEEIGMTDVTTVDDYSQLQINAWICNGQVLRCVLNPLTPLRIPYFVIPYETNPYQLWGVGIAENMEDAQLLMNGHVRMAIDNLALAGNLVFDVDEASLVPGQNMDIFPGKIFRRQSGVTGTAINGLKFPNTAGENLQMYQISRQLADEETGIPSIMHGQTGVNGTGRTAAGLSMLMGGANLSMKTVIKNIDDYLLKPLGESYFQWNMQFNEDMDDVKGDLEIKPRGVAAIMQKEVRSQRLIGLLQTVANPMLAPFIKIPNLIRELAISQDIDPESLVNDVNEAQIYAEMLKGMQANAEQRPSQNDSPPSQQSPNVGGAGGVPQQSQDNSGASTDGSTIGVGDATAAGEAGFTGNTPQNEI